jgi:hypothetical protein
VLNVATVRRAVLGLGAALALVAGAAQAQPAPSVIGDWTGTLQAGKTTIDLVLHVTPAAKGLPNAGLDIPARGVADLPGRVVDQHGSTSQILFLEAGADYTANLSADGKTLTGKWTQGPASLPLVMTRRDSAVAAAH